jgi:hypothetical protein
MLTMTAILRAQKLEATYGRGSGFMGTGCHNPRPRRTRPASGNDNSAGDFVVVEYGQDPRTGEFRYSMRAVDAASGK